MLTRACALAALLGCFAMPALAQQGALPVSALPMAGSAGTSAPSTADQIFVEQGVTTPGTGKAVRAPLSAYLGTSAAYNVGTVGNVVPLASGLNVWWAFNQFGAGNVATSLKAINNVTSASFATSNSFSGFSAVADEQVSPTTPNQSLFQIGSALTGQISAPSGGSATTLAASASGGATSIQVAAVPSWVGSGATLFFTLADGTPFKTNVSGARSGNTLSLSIAVPAAGASSGAPVWFPSGHVQGAITAAILTPGVTFTSGAEGFEGNISVRSGSSVAFKCVVCAAPNSDDAVQGTFYDMGFGLSTTATSVGLQNGLAFGPWSGKQPLVSTGTIIRTYGPSTVANFIDFSSYSCTGNEVNFTGFVVDCSGNLKAASLTATSLPTSCASKPTGTVWNNGGVLNVCP